MEIKIEAPEIVNALDTLTMTMRKIMELIVTLEEQETNPARSLIGEALEIAGPIKEIKIIHRVPAEDAAETITPEQDEAIPYLPGKEPAKVIGLDEVRAKLGALVAAGKQSELKNLLTKFGAAKMSEVPAEKRAALLKEAEAI